VDTTSKEPFMAENRRGKENRFYFSRGQLVLLGGAFALASVVIFILGMIVGQGIEERKLLKRDEPLVKIPVTPPSRESSGAPASKDEITFNNATPKAPPVAASAQGPAKAEKPAEKVAKLDAKEKKTPAKTAEAPTRPVEKKSEKNSAAEEPGKTPPVAEAAPTQEAGKTWRAQVNAYPDERSAKLIVDRLKNKGYNAYVTEAQNKGKTWYRVSVGKYASREEAEKIVEVLRSKENFPKAFVASR